MARGQPAGRRISVIDATQSPGAEFRLNQHLDLKRLAERYAEKSRLSIADIFTPDSASRLHACLASEVPWGFAWYDGEARYYRAEEMAALSPARQQQLLDELYARARRGFQYAYNVYPMLDAYLAKWGQVPLLDRFIEYLNSPPLLEAIRTITGREDIIKGDAQATRYGPGQFLKQHTDAIAEEHRVAAYVINLTRDWDPDWGGYLQFYDASGDIEWAVKPRFNVLNLFTVPQTHSVGYVASYAHAQRFAITGWFRNR